MSVNIEEATLKDKLNYYKTSSDAYDYYAKIATITMENLFKERGSVNTDKIEQIQKQNQNAEQQAAHFQKVKDATFDSIISDQSFINYSNSLMNQTPFKTDVSFDDKVNFQTASIIAYNYYAAVANEKMQILFNERGSVNTEGVRKILTEQQEAEQKASYFMKLKEATTSAIISDPAFIDYSANIVVQQELAPNPENSLPTNILK